MTERDPRRGNARGTPLDVDPEREAEWEIRHHIEERTDRLVEEGWEPDAARREAERRFGDAGRVQRELVDMGRTDEGGRKMRGWIDGVVQDVRYALRGMRRNPGFAATVCLTLGVGIGAAGAIFSVVDAVMLRPLPFDDPDRIVEVSLVRGESDITLPFLLADQLDPYRDAADFFEETAYSETLSLTRTDGAEPEVLRVLAVSPGMDELLGVDAALGRLFGLDDAVPGAERAIVLSHGYWTRTGADPDIVGRTLRLEDEPWTVVGVLPPHVKYPVADSGPEGWVALSEDATAAGQPLDRMQLVGRLRPGVDVAAARKRADALASTLAEERPHPVGWRVHLSTLAEWRGNERFQRGLWLLAGAVGLMLAISLANAVNILLVRATARRSEWAVRRSVGASRARLVRTTLLESVALAVVGGVAAVGAAAGLVAVLRGAIPPEFTLSSVYPLELEGRALLFVFLTAMVAGVIVGVPAALTAAGRKDRGLAATANAAHRARRPVQSVFVVGAVALSVTLLAGAGLFARSLHEMMTIEPGIAVDSLAIVELSPNERTYPTPEARRAFLDRVVEEIARDGRVEGIAVARGLPPRGVTSFTSELQAEGGEPIDEFTLLGTSTVEVGSEGVLGVPVVEGRTFREEDAERPVVLVDRDLARMLFGDRSPVGRRLRWGPDGPWLEIVGLMDELKLGGMNDDVTPYALLRPAAPGELDAAWVTLGVRADDPAALLPTLRDAVRRVDSRQPVAELTTARRALAESVRGPRFLTLVMSGLALVAALLAAIGVYGVLSYAVSRRRREMGIRMAVGASRDAVRRRVLRSGAGLALGGAALGLVMTLSLAHLAEDLLFQVQAGDPLSMVGAAALMFATAVAACWIPARRATRVDPVEVLRTE